jgi:hypothetical protein
MVRGSNENDGLNHPTLRGGPLDGVVIAVPIGQPEVVRVTPTGQFARYVLDAPDYRFDGYADDVPQEELDRLAAELSDADRAALDRTGGPDFIDRLFREEKRGEPHD